MHIFKLWMLIYYLIVAGLFSGCVMKPSSYKENTTSIGNNPLYIAYDNKADKFLNSISNQEPDFGVKLNNLSPVGFDTKYYLFDKVTSRSNMDYQFMRTSNKYEKIDCDNSFSYLKEKPVYCYYEHSFESDGFNYIVKKTISDFGYDQLSLIELHDQIIAEKKNYEKELFPLLVEKNKAYDALVKEYEKNYVVPKIERKIIDTAKLYKNEELQIPIVIPNKLPVRNLYSHFYDSIYQKIFPCTGNNECLMKLKDAQVEMQSSHKKWMQSFETEANDLYLAYEEELQKLTSSFSVKSPQGTLITKNGNKTLYYTIKTSDTVNSKDKSLIVTYEILYVDDKTPIKPISTENPYSTENIDWKKYGDTVYCKTKAELDASKSNNYSEVSIDKIYRDCLCKQKGYKEFCRKRK